MSKRIYFLVPDAEGCRRVLAELLELGVTDRQIHVIGNLATPLDELRHEAGFLQRSDFAHALRAGLGLGGIAGLLGGLLAVTFPPAGVTLGGGALLLATTFLGAGGGALVAALIGSDMPNSELRAFQEAIDAGELLMMVDLPRDQLERVSAAVRQHHPEASITVRPRPEPGHVVPGPAAN